LEIKHGSTLPFRPASSLGDQIVDRVGVDPWHGTAIGKGTERMSPVLTTTRFSASIARAFAMEPRFTVVIDVAALQLLAVV
jgi:hypothetical protein